MQPETEDMKKAAVQKKVSVKQICDDVFQWIVLRISNQLE